MAIKIYDEIALFGRKGTKREWVDNEWVDKGSYYDFYVCDANNKNMLETGEYWAKRNRKEDSSVKYVVKNNGFKLSLDEAASGSSQGGKLSFWMCKIEKDDISGRVGINQTELNELFKESTFVNGVCQQEVCFYRINNNVGACVVGGERYKQFHDQQNNDEDIRKAPKTTKWEQGRVYKTLTTSEMWLCDITNILDDNKGHLIINNCEEYNSAKELVDNIRSYKLNTVDKFKSKTATDKVFDLSNIKELFYNKHKELILEELKTNLKNIDEEYRYYTYYSDIYNLGYCIDKNMFPMAEYIDMLTVKYYYLSHIAYKSIYSDTLEKAIDNIVKYLEILGCCDYNNINKDDIMNIKRQYKYDASYTLK